MKEASHDPALTAPESTEAPSANLRSTRDDSTQNIITTETAVLATSTITQSSSSTITQLIALNPAYRASSVNDRPCPDVSTVTVTVVATNTVEYSSPTIVKYKNVTMSTTVSGSSPSTLSAVTAATIDPCVPTSLPGLVGLQIPSGSGAACTTGSVSASTTGGGSRTTSTLPFSTGAVGVTNVNVAFLIGFAALAAFV